MNKRFEVTERSKRVATLAKLLGYDGDDSKMKDVDVFLGKRFKLAPKSIAQIRWKYKFSPDNSAKILKALGGKAQHFEGLSDFLSIDADGKVLPSLRTGQKSAKKKAAKKAAKPSKTPAVKAPPVVAKASAAAPAPTPKAGVVPSASVLEISGSDGRKIMITEVMHEGSLHSAILLPVGSALSVTSGKTGFTITVK